MKRAIVAVILSSALLVAAGSLCLSRAQSWEYEDAVASSHEPSVRLIQFGDPDMDLGSCQQDCRSRYGLEMHGGRGGGSHGIDMYYLYARCIEDCNRRFWKRFDKETEETK